MGRHKRNEEKLNKIVIKAPNGLKIFEIPIDISNRIVDRRDSLRRLSEFARSTGISRGIGTDSNMQYANEESVQQRPEILTSVTRVAPIPSILGNFISLGSFLPYSSPTEMFEAIYKCSDA